MNAAEFKSVGKSYDGKEVLTDFSLAVEKGERIVILGPSGCGKTTGLRLLAGFIAPTNGTISITGEIVAKDGRNFKEPENRGLGMVFQDLALWPHMTVKENIEFGLKAKKIPDRERQERIRNILGLLQIEDKINTKPSLLSGGQKQRVALARSLALLPEILLMDEPLSSLDFELSFKLRAEILHLQKDFGFSLLYVTHDLEEAFSIATKIVLMKNGRIDQIGSCEKMKQYLESIRTK